MLHFRRKIVSLLSTGLLLCTLPLQAKAPHSIAGWGIVTDPDGDCSIVAKGGKLTVTVPGTVHDLSIVYAKKAAVNPDGVKWIHLAPAIGAFPDKIQVGVNTINTSKRPFTAVFDKFRVTQQ